jgi:hypothetical protein
MDAKRKEMDLLSNSLAAYAHIKGQSINQSITLTTAVVTLLLKYHKMNQ